MSYNTSDARIQKRRIAIRSKRGSKNIEISPRKTNKHFYLTVYDCSKKQDIYSTSTIKLLKSGKINKSYGVDSAYQTGKELGKWVLDRKLKDCFFFNKLHYKFHGRLERALAGIYETIES